MNGAFLREPRGSSVPASVPAVPAPVPAIREAVPAGSLIGSPFAPVGSPFPFYRGNGERARPRTSRSCSLTKHSCGMPVLTGLDADRAALTVTVDPYPLTPLGEVQALRAHRPTYLLTARQLDRRDRWNIPGRPPTHARTVLATHDCTGIPDTWRLPPPPPAPPRPEVRF